MRTKPLYKLTIEEVDRICTRYLPNCEECPLHTHIRAPPYGRCLRPIIWALCEDRELLDTPIEIDKEE